MNRNIYIFQIKALAHKTVNDLGGPGSRNVGFSQFFKIS